ncbi:hypothetical protein F9U64_00115 [Gracilibacillus oryzae]|uniref:DUF8042 domain-containing protein n=1 Tax=Gracilibacillus oryzae TaxID=1672701 RepID=A0A7C8GX94_9BACI|nr:hypothetical protein [Gracilibacillus oryzae]KAB8139474.1 hypothetical protein F9U64_00115 [Gracilibacillus oryzae]
MEKQLDVMKNVLGLSETVLEGVLHIQSALKERQMEETMYLFEDIIHAFATIENAINELDDEYVSEEVTNHMKKVQKGLEAAVQQYEVEISGRLQEVLQFNLVPATKNWKIALENQFNPLVLN